MNVHACADLCLPWKRVFRFGLLLESGAPFEQFIEAVACPGALQLVRIAPGHGHRRVGHIAVKHGGWMVHSCVALRMINPTASPPFESCRPPFRGHIRGAVYCLLHQPRLDNLVLLHFFTCILARPSLHLSQSCSTFWAVAQKSSCGDNLIDQPEQTILSRGRG
jgi:hypothetical protein